MIITSRTNESVKRIAALKEKKGRREARAYLVEGVKQVREALAGGLPVERVVLSERYAGEEFSLPPEKLLRVSASVFEKLSEEFLTYRYLTQLFVLEKEDEGALKKPDLLDKCDNVAGAIFLGECAADYVSAARVDGAGTVRIFLTIVLPVLKPALAAVAIFSFQGFWNDYMGPLIYIKDPDLYTVAQALTLYQMPQETLWGDMMAAALVTILPIVFCFAFCQKYFIQGITLGGVKG